MSLTVFEGFCLEHSRFRWTCVISGHPSVHRHKIQCVKSILQHNAANSDLPALGGKIIVVIFPSSSNGIITDQKLLHVFRCGLYQSSTGYCMK